MGPATKPPPYPEFLKGKRKFLAWHGAAVVVMVVVVVVAVPAVVLPTAGSSSSSSGSNSGSRAGCIATLDTVDSP